MRSDTQSITIDVDPRELFAFVANPETLPMWAVGFCRSIRRDGDRFWVGTREGEVEIRYVTDAASAVIDFHISPLPGVEAVAHSRVLPNGSGAEYVFTQFQAPGMPDAHFEGQIETLKEELVVLRSILRARASCPR